MSTSSQRIVAATTATLTWQGVDQDGEPADPGTVTVAVTRADGATVLAAGTATSGTGSNPRAVGLTAAQTAQLDVLTATWTVGGVAVGVTTHEVVGDVYATVAEIRSLEDSLADVSANTDNTIKRCRSEVESTIEQVCRQAFVPRFSVLRVGMDLKIRIPNLRTVRWTRTVSSSGILTPADPFGVNFGPWYYPDVAVYVLAGVEHGLDCPPPDLKRAAIKAIRRQVNMSKSAVDARAISYTGPSGETQRFPTPGLGPWITGLPDVDEVLQRYTMPDVPGVIRVGPSVLPLPVVPGGVY